MVEDRPAQVAHDSWWAQTWEVDAGERQDLTEGLIPWNPDTEPFQYLGRLPEDDDSDEDPEERVTYSATSSSESDDLRPRLFDRHFKHSESETSTRRDIKQLREERERDRLSCESMTQLLDASEENLRVFEKSTKERYRVLEERLTALEERLPALEQSWDRREKEREDAERRNAYLEGGCKRKKRRISDRADELADESMFSDDDLPPEKRFCRRPTRLADCIQTKRDNNLPEMAEYSSKEVNTGSTPPSLDGNNNVGMDFGLFDDVISDMNEQKPTRKTNKTIQNTHQERLDEINKRLDKLKKESKERKKETDEDMARLQQSLSALRRSLVELFTFQRRLYEAPVIRGLMRVTAAAAKKCNESFDKDNFPENLCQWASKVTDAQLSSNGVSAEECEQVKRLPGMIAKRRADDTGPGTMVRLVSSDTAFQSEEHFFWHNLVPWTYGKSFDQLSEEGINGVDETEPRPKWQPRRGPRRRR